LAFKPGKEVKLQDRPVNRKLARKATKTIRENGRVLNEQAELNENIKRENSSTESAALAIEAQRHQAYLRRPTKRLEAINEHNKAIQEAVEKIDRMIFGNFVYEALPIDEDAKAVPANTEKIYNEAISAYDHTLVTVSTSPYFKNIEGNATVLLDKEPIDGKLGDKACAEISAKLATHDLTAQYAKTLIKNKIVDAVRDEALIADRMDKAKDKGEYVEESNTLYRTLYLASLNGVLDESDSTDQSTLEEQANVNALLGLTIMESLHTLKLKESIDLKDLSTALANTKKRILTK